jgi:hypothetical protein
MKFGATRIGLAVMSLTLTLSARPSATGGVMGRARVQAADSIKVVLSEVLFVPRAADTSFVELANVGTTTVDLSDYVLRVDTVEVPLPPLPTPFAAGTRVLIRFDGPAPTEGNVVHASADVALKPEGGAVALLSNKDRVLDRVAWGDAPDAIMPPRGGMPAPRVDAGSSFGRPPGAYQPGASTDWVIYPPEQVTPGRPNLPPAVFQLLPLSGAILQTAPVSLSWYPVPGAVRYRMQIARDTTFTPLILDQTVGVPEISSGQLASGIYWWRVQAIPAEGPPAAWSPSSRLQLDGRRPGGGTGQDSGDEGDAEAPEGLGSSSSPRVKPMVLDVPMIYQHKDSHMLLLESQQSGGSRPRTATSVPRNPHAWDRDHGDLDKQDPADNMNCVLATLTMINHFYGGDLTQDRIGYEVFGPNVAKYEAMIPPGLVLSGPKLRERAPGPERDLNYGYGVWNRQEVAAGFFAFGAPPGPGSGLGPNFTMLSTMWNTIVVEIDAGRPVAGSTRGHSIVIRGYDILDGRKRIYVNDPWFGQYIMDFVLGAEILQGAVVEIFTWPSHPAIGHLEPESKRDSDGDGVYDFDEINRFHTDPNKADTDGDGVPDYQDIEAGVYEDEFRLGYAWNPSYGSPGRDFDGDGKPTELDPDSDNGGCKDGDEDASFNGFHENPETSNFNQADDMCGTLRGSLNYEIDLEGTDENSLSMIKKVHDEGVILVRLKPRSPGSDHYVDDSSTFNYRGFARIEVGDSTCKLVGREIATGGGLIAKSDGEIGGTRGNDGTLTVGAGAQVRGHSSASGCGIGGSSKIFRGMSWPSCTGRLAPPNSRSTVRGSLTYEFNCTAPLTPTPGIRILHYHARGFVRVQAPP